MWFFLIDVILRVFMIGHRKAHQLLVWKDWVVCRLQQFLPSSTSKTRYLSSLASIYALKISFRIAQQVETSVDWIVPANNWRLRRTYTLTHTFIPTPIHKRLYTWILRTITRKHIYAHRGTNVQVHTYIHKHNIHKHIHIHWRSQAQGFKKTRSCLSSGIVRRIHAFCWHSASCKAPDRRSSESDFQLMKRNQCMCCKSRKLQ